MAATWNPQQVAVWLGENNLKQYADVFMQVRCPLRTQVAVGRCEPAPVSQPRRALRRTMSAAPCCSRWARATWRASSA